MKKIITIIFLCYASTIVYGQQLPHYSLYMLNEVIINPAALSKEKDNKITFMLRDQWGSFPGAPTTQSISYNYLNNKKYKRGISVMNDVTGPISIINAKVSGSFSIPISDANRFAVGVSATFMQYSIDNSKIILSSSTTDNALSSGFDKAMGHSFAIGSYYYSPNYFIGLSVPNIFGSSLDISESSEDNKLEDHYYINGGYNINLKNNNKIIPSLMLKKIGGLPFQLDINLRGGYHDFLWAGISYRTEDAVVALFGVNYDRSSLGYSYDITTSSIRIPSSGTHGLVYSYRFIKKKKDRDKDGVFDDEDDCPRIPGLVSLKGCPDKDKDGIKDSEDDCPEEFGLRINNGCPDMDSDGIADRNDTCPATPGLARFNGCPDTDGDGLQDKLDECPEEPGPILNKGCPNSPGGDTITIIKYIYLTDTVYLPAKEVQLLERQFENIQFDHNTYTLVPSSKSILSDVAIYLIKKSKLKIKLIGHTDDVADSNSNMILSENRVKSVERYLISKGVSESRIKIDWKGETSPLVTSTSKEARAKNRRVDIEVYLLNENE